MKNNKSFLKNTNQKFKNLFEKTKQVFKKPSVKNVLAISFAFDIFISFLLFFLGLGSIVSLVKTNTKIENVSSEVVELRHDFLTSFNTLFVDNEQFQEDIEVIENYLNTLSTKEELNSAISNIENGIVDGDYVSAVMHANVFRGKNLGEEVTVQQKEAIQSGSFNDIFVGDYWYINSTVYRVADIDYYYNLGNPVVLNHHIIIVPDQYFYMAQINDVESNACFYTNTKMHTENLNNATLKITEDFGEMLMYHPVCVTSYPSNSGSPQGGYCCDIKVCLMSEMQVVGFNAFSSISCTYDTKQFSLFSLKKSYITCRSSYWLRDTVSGTKFSAIQGNGYIQQRNVTEELAVRPYFCIG